MHLRPLCFSDAVLRFRLCDLAEPAGLRQNLPRLHPEQIRWMKVQIWPRPGCLCVVQFISAAPRVADLWAADDLIWHGMH